MNLNYRQMKQTIPTRTWKDIADDKMHLIMISVRLIKLILSPIYFLVWFLIWSTYPLQWSFIAIVSYLFTGNSKSYFVSYEYRGFDTGALHRGWKPQYWDRFENIRYF